MTRNGFRGWKVGKNTFSVLEQPLDILLRGVVIPLPVFVVGPIRKKVAKLFCFSLFTKKGKEIWATSRQGDLHSQIFKPTTTTLRQVTMRGEEPGEELSPLTFR